MNIMSTGEKFPNYAYFAAQLDFTLDDLFTNCEGNLSDNQRRRLHFVALHAACGITESYSSTGTDIFSSRVSQ